MSFFAPMVILQVQKVKDICVPCAEIYRELKRLCKQCRRESNRFTHKSRCDVAVHSGLFSGLLFGAGKANESSSFDAAAGSEEMHCGTMYSVLVSLQQRIETSELKLDGLGMQAMQTRAGAAAPMLQQPWFRQP